MDWVALHPKKRNNLMPRTFPLKMVVAGKALGTRLL